MVFDWSILPSLILFILSIPIIPIDLKFGVVLIIQAMISQGLDLQLLQNWKDVFKLVQKVLGN